MGNSIRYILKYIRKHTMTNRFYVTTAIDYTNDVIHLGHAYQKVLADVLARYHRQIGDKTFFLTGTDEHGSKSEQAAKDVGKTPKEFVDEISKKDQEQQDALNISYDRFIRTTDPDHKELVKNFWLNVKKNGDIYKGKYTGLYCVGCEAYKTESEIVDGKCTLHPTKELQKVTEENYFFRWSKYADFLKKHIAEHPKFIQPKERQREMLAFLEQGIQDITVSRQKNKVSWGIPVPDDPDQVIYVWFDALINYISGASDFWPADVHILGKDNARWHILLWPAMLKSAGYELPKTVYVHSFFSIDGQKISKSLGNVIRPTDFVKNYTVDGARYYLIKHGPLIEDVDIRLDHVKKVYNADLANNLGNLVARVARLAEDSNTEFPSFTRRPLARLKELDKFRFGDALAFIWQKITKANKFIDENKPWELIDKDKEIDKVLNHLVDEIREIATLLKPFLPETAEKIEKQFAGPKIKTGKPLFPRLP